jgi:hypothetical protein
LKPDLVAPGGCDQHPIHLVSICRGLKLLSYGTSFASPIVAALAAQATDRFDRGTALLARALLIHTASHPNGSPDHQLGHGIVRPTIDDILRCENKEVTIAFQDNIQPKKMIRLPLMLPSEIGMQGKVFIKWTIAALPSVSPNHPSDYTSYCLEDTFYPNDQVFSFSTKNKNLKPNRKNLHLQDDKAEVAALLADGWSQSELPVSQSGNKYPSEHERRSLDYKWEPIVRHQDVKVANSLHQPFLVLHAIPRNGAATRFDYAAIVTIHAPKFEGDLYDAVLRHYPVLQPIRLRTESEIRVQI